MRASNHAIRTYISTRSCAAAALLGCGAVMMVNAAPQQDAVGQPAGDFVPASAAERWRERLEALRPAQPMTYFELAEEIADETVSPEDVDLAQRLFKLAGVLDPQRLGRSSALALAALETDDMNRQRLLALAVLLDERGGRAAEMLRASATEEASRDAVLAVADAMSHFRRGDGSRANTALRTEGATELLERYSAHLPGGHRRFLTDAQIYRGGQRPILNEDDVNKMLRLELALLSGERRSWSSELLLHSARPLIEVDPADLAGTFAIDATRTVYRNGEWGRP